MGSYQMESKKFKVNSPQREEDISDLEALKKVVKIERLKDELQQLQDTVKSQREAKESVERLHFLNKIEEAKQERKIVSKELDETKVELEKHIRKVEQIKPLQDKYTFLKEMLSDYENLYIPMFEHKKKIAEVRKEYEQKIGKYNAKFEEFKVFTQTQMDKKDQKNVKFQNIQKIV